MPGTARESYTPVRTSFHHSLVALFARAATGRNHGKEGEVRGKAHKSKTERSNHSPSFLKGVSQGKSAPAHDGVD